MILPRRMICLVTLLLAAVPSIAAAATGPASVLPPGTAVSGWKQIGATRNYNRGNLFELIDGEAEAILAYNFVAEAHAEYAPANQSRQAITIDVFDVSDPLNAFGVFSSDRISGRPVSIGTEGVQIGDTGLSFWKGRYVVRLAIVERSPGPAARAAMDCFARVAASRILGSGGPPAVVQALPAGRQPHSEKYTLRNAAGHAFLTNAVSARYPAVGQGAELFIATYPTPAGARAALEAYRKFEATGTGLAAVPGLGQVSFHVQDRFAKNVVVAQKGRYLVFITHARDAATAQNMVRQALARVR